MTNRSRTALRAAAVLALAGLATAVPVAAGQAAPPPAGFQTVFTEDFDGPEGAGLDRSRWIYDLGHSYPGGEPNWGTGEIAEMTDRPENVRLDGAGNLLITPQRDASGNWTSGRVETQRTDFAAPEGGVLRVEANLKMPDVGGAQAAGYWPAFWMLGEPARPASATNWPRIGEIDIMEAINGRDSHFGAMHCGVAPGGPCNEFTGLTSGEQSCEGCRTGFHTYAIEYDRSLPVEEIRWYRDGRNYFTVRADQMDRGTWDDATKHGFFVILNVAMGGGFPGAFGAPLPTAETAPGRPMVVDWVTVSTR